MDAVRTVVLVLALLQVGLMAGLFFAFTTAVMPGLRRVDDRAFTTAFQKIDRAIVNPLFVTVLVGAFVSTGAAGLLHLGRTEPAALIGAAFAMYLALIVITGTVHVPRNDALRAEGDADTIDATAARARFDEHRWARWNTVRTVLSVAAFGCLAAALAIG